MTHAKKNGPQSARSRLGLIAGAVFALFCAPARATVYTVAVSTDGPLSADSVVTSTPSGIVCPPTCSAAFSSGTVVTLGEVSASTVAFAAWSSDGENESNCNTNQPDCLVTVTATASTVTAHFDPTVDVSIAGNGIGVVTSTTGASCSSGGACSSGAPLRLVLPMGATVFLTESTGTATAFVGWTGGPGCGTASTCTFTLNGYEAVVATFTASGTVGVSSFTVTVTLPNAGGSVRSTPAGINCPGACSAAFVDGGTVSFSTRAAAGYRFAGWANGGCAGTSPCVVTSSSPLQGLGGPYSPAAFFYPSGGTNP